MGYDVVIEKCNLRFAASDEDKVFKTLKHGTLELSDFWKIEKDSIFPAETWFKYGDWFEEDLKKMAKMGAIGFIETRGEAGEYVKYVLRNEKVEFFGGIITYPSEPDEILE